MNFMLKVKVIIDSLMKRAQIKSPTELMTLKSLFSNSAGGVNLWPAVLAC